MVPLNYHHLYYFWTIARAGSLTAATERVYLSQSALSHQLNELERAFKIKLLERGRRGVSLTPEGRIVFERCERIFSEGEDLAALVRDGFKAQPVLRLGIQPTLSREVVIRILAFARQIDKDCRITVVSGELDVLIDKLRRRTIDLIVANEDCSRSVGPDYASRLVGHLPVYFVANRAVKSVVRRFPADLARTAMLLRPADNPVRKQVDRYLGRRRIKIKVEADCEDVDILRRMAMEGRGVAPLSALSVAADLKSGRLVTLHASPLGIRENIWFVCPARPHSDASFRSLIDALMKRFSVFGKVPAVRSSLDR